jgi:hypothetical protein
MRDDLRKLVRKAEMDCMARLTHAHTHGFASQLHMHTRTPLSADADWKIKNVLFRSPYTRVANGYAQQASALGWGAYAGWLQARECK